MGTHKDAWAVQTIERIATLGNSLDYVAATTEHRITRGWVDVCWMWNVELLASPPYLLVAEVETSKADWPRIRNNAAKAVGLKPLIYAHIFKPNIVLTPAERQQLLVSLLFIPY